MSTRPLIKEALTMLSVVGLNPNLQNRWNKFKSCVIFVLLFFIFVEIILDFVFNKKGWDSVDEFIAFGSFFQILSKVIFLILKGKPISVLLKVMGNFWSWAEVGKELLEEFEQSQKFLREFMMLYGVAVASTVVAYVFKPFFMGFKTLPFETYHPADLTRSSSYQLIYGVQIFCMAFGCFSVFCLDYLFASLIIQMVCEIKIIKGEFFVMQNTSIKEERFKKITHLIEHHNLVLKCIQALNEICSRYLLNQLFNSLILMCIGLVGMITSSYPLDLKPLFKCATFLLSVLFQLFIYCVLGAYLTEECGNLSWAVYESDWWTKTQPELRRTYVLIIQRANKRENLTAGGMVLLNLESFTSILKMSLSFYTVAQALYRKTSEC